MAVIRPSTAARNPMLQAILDHLNLGSAPGTIKIYDGPQPANADAPLSGNTLLAALQFADPASGAPVDGTVTLSPISQVNAVANGTATWAWMQDSDGNNVFDGDVKADGEGFFNFNVTSFAAGYPVRITEFSLTVPVGFAY